MSMAANFTTSETPRAAETRRCKLNRFSRVQKSGHVIAFDELDSEVIVMGAVKRRRAV
jgi:hypothetical protein